MIVFRMTMTTIPEKRLEIQQTLLSMIEPTVNKAGCLSFGVYCDIENANRFSLLGEWKTRQYLNRHLSSQAFGVLLGTKALLCEPLEIQIYTVSHLEGMTAIKKIRNKEGAAAERDADSRR